MGAFDGIADFIADFKALKGKVADLAVAISPEAVRYVGTAGQPTFQSSWVNFDSVHPAGFYRQGGRVYLCGLVKNGTAIGTPIFTLPAGYFPLEAANNIIATVSNDAFGAIFISPTGVVNGYEGSTAYVSLEGISFRHA